MASTRKQTALRILAVVFSASLMLIYVACNSLTDGSSAPETDRPEGQTGDDTSGDPAEPDQEDANTPRHFPGSKSAPFVMPEPENLPGSKSLKLRLPARDFFDAPPQHPLRDTPTTDSQ